MPDMNQKLDRFTAKILAEAADESKRALAEVKRRRELRFQEAEDAALKEAAKTAQAALDEVNGGK